MPPATIGEDPATACADTLAAWMTSELACIAGRREWARGRYAVADLEQENMPSAVARFAAEVRQFSKVGLLCLIPRTARNMDPLTPSIEVLGEISGFGASVSARSAEELLNSAVLELPILLDCPVTGFPTTYSFFGVAFCPQAANPEDALYDLPLSAPFPCINITSDGFAFAMFVRDTALARHGVPPRGLVRPEERAALFADCVLRWQKFSLHTLTTLAEKTAGTRCPVRVSDDGTRWQAVHNDPVFAETRKETHSHEMPCLYASDLAEHWTAVLERRETHLHARAGQSGGTPVESSAKTAGCRFAAVARLFGRAAPAH